MSDKWEILAIAHVGYEDAEAHSAGADGWELVSVVYNANAYTSRAYSFFFKRRVEVK